MATELNCVYSSATGSCSTEAYCLDIVKDDGPLSNWDKNTACIQQINLQPEIDLKHLQATALDFRFWIPFMRPSLKIKQDYLSS